MIVFEGAEISRPFRLGSGWPGPAPGPGFRADRVRYLQWSCVRHPTGLMAGSPELVDLPRIQLDAGVIKRRLLPPGRGREEVPHSDLVKAGLIAGERGNRRP